MQFNVESIVIKTNTWTTCAEEEILLQTSGCAAIQIYCVVVVTYL